MSTALLQFSSNQYISKLGYCMIYFLEAVSTYDKI